MIKGEYDYLDTLAKNNVCSEHKKPLTVATHPQDSCWVLRCGEGHYPDAVTRISSQSELFKQGRILEDHYDEETMRKEEKRMTEVKKESTAITFVGVPATDLATGELLPVGMLKALVDYAYKYGMDPARGHVVVMYPKPYITIDGYLYWANQNMPGYKLNSRPLTGDERKTYLVPDGAHAWVCEVIFDEGKQSRIGLGIVTFEEVTEKSKKHPEQLRSPVVAKHPWQLAQKRAEWQALRRMCPIGETKEE